jgi:hypothetical protein
VVKLLIANKSNNARVFLEKDVSKALIILGYTMKVTSTVARGGTDKIVRNNLLLVFIF